MLDLTALLRRSLEKGGKREPVQLSMVPPVQKPKKAAKAATAPVAVKRPPAKNAAPPPVRTASASARPRTGRKAA